MLRQFSNTLRKLMPVGIRKHRGGKPPGNPETAKVGNTAHFSANLAPALARNGYSKRTINGRTDDSRKCDVPQSPKSFRSGPRYSLSFSPKIPMDRQMSVHR